ncbi:MAG: single-stranded-DNA-specific exonuclease RecJ [Lachnospiraceae bacterium]|nr:single-stranded-DNA-specific exonuclease RecJ [Lachnospiraceae bacterium]
MKKIKEQWMLHTKKADFSGLGAKLGVDPVLIRIMRNRNLVTENEFRHFLYDTPADMHDPWLLKDMRRAVNLILAALGAGTRIRIISDYDIDGVCSGAILLRGLKSLGADVDLAIPNRIMDGYGINDSLIGQAYDDGIGMIITCDNGIAAVDAIRYAKELGLTVIVTDHHDIPFEETATDKCEILPPADAIINPKQSDCEYPCKHLCGGGVAYKLMDALFRQVGRGETAVLPLLELAAIATIGDIVDLQGENRIIARYGLQMIRESKYIGVRKLAEVNQIALDTISAYHIGFILGPCLNASGRLDSAKMAAELLLLDGADAEKQAENIALQLKELNDIRKAMTNEGVEEAKKQLDFYADDQVLVLYLPNCHESLAGIIAGRIREYCYKPTIILTNAEEGAKGSARSIEAYNMFEKLSQCKDLMTKFGGHPMAAGLSLPEENIDILRKRLNAQANLSEKDLTPKTYIDLRMSLKHVSETLIEELKILEPFGKANEKPVFAERHLSVVRLGVLGKKRNVIRMTFEDETGLRMDGIAFGDSEEILETAKCDCGAEAVEAALAGRTNPIYADILFEPSVNEYLGRRTLQLRLLSFRFCAES